MFLKLFFLKKLDDIFKTSAYNFKLWNKMILHYWEKKFFYSEKLILKSSPPVWFFLLLQNVFSIPLRMSHGDVTSKSRFISPNQIQTYVNLFTYTIQYSICVCIGRYIYLWSIIPSSDSSLLRIYLFILPQIIIFPIFMKIHWQYKCELYNVQVSTMLSDS